MSWQNAWVYLYGVKMRQVPIKPFLILATPFNRRADQHAKIINTFVARRVNSSPCFDPPPVNCELNRLIRARMPSCIPGSRRNLPLFSRRVHPLQRRSQKDADGEIGTPFPPRSSWIGCILPCVCCSFWIIWQAITVAIW